MTKKQKYETLKFLIDFAEKFFVLSKEQQLAVILDFKKELKKYE